MMGIYTPLKKHLLEQDYQHINMSFAQIESVIGRDLPNSARDHRAWWSNSYSNGLTVHMDAGYFTEGVDMAAEKLTFRKVISEKVGLLDQQKGEGASSPIGGNKEADVSKKERLKNEGYDLVVRSHTEPARKWKGEYPNKTASGVLLVVSVSLVLSVLYLLGVYILLPVVEFLFPFLVLLMIGLAFGLISAGVMGGVYWVWSKFV